MTPQSNLMVLAPVATGRAPDLRQLLVLRDEGNIELRGDAFVKKKFAGELSGHRRFAARWFALGQDSPGDFPRHFPIDSP